MQMEDFPYLLIVSENPFGFDNGFGVTLSNLFAGWPPERLRILYTSDQFQPDRSQFPDAIRAHVPLSPGRRFAIPFLLGLKPEWRGNYSKPWLRSALSEFQPNLVYSFVHSDSTLRFADWLGKELEVPHVMHVADDGLGKCDISEIRKLCEGAGAHFAISETMAREYKDRYGHRWEVFHNGAHSDYFLSAEERDDQASGLRIRYLGNLLPSQHFDALNDVIDAIIDLNSDGRKAMLELYGSETPAGCSDQLLRNGSVKHLGSVSRREGIRLLQEADLLIIPASFSEAEQETYRFSFPTKLPEYLASGTPTIIYAPAYSAISNFCRENELGLLVDRRDSEALGRILVELKADREAFREQARRDRRYAQEHMSVIGIKKRFQTLLKDLSL